MGPSALILPSVRRRVTCALYELVVQGPRINRERLRSLFWGLCCRLWGRRRLLGTGPGGAGVPERARAASAACSAAACSRSGAVIRGLLSCTETAVALLPLVTMRSFVRSPPPSPSNLFVFQSFSPQDSQAGPCQICGAVND